MSYARYLIKKFYSNKLVSKFIGSPINILEFLIKKKIIIVPMTNQPRISLWVTSTEYQLRNLKKNRNILLIFLNNIQDSYPNEYLYNYLKKNSIVIDINSKIKKFISSLLLYLFERTNPQNIYFYNVEDIFNGLPKHFYFLNSEIKKGDLILKKMNFNFENNYVVINIRENSYLQKNNIKKRSILKQVGEQYDFRNQDINNYNHTINSLRVHNYSVMKTGSVYSQKISLNSDNFYDYSRSKNKNHFMDLYVYYRSIFSIIGASGSWSYSTIFDKPIVYVGLYWPYIIPSKKNDLFIPGLYFEKTKKRYLSILEMDAVFKKYNHNTITSSLLSSLNLEFHQNIPEDIWDVTEEMILRLKNKWNSSSEDEYLNKKFNSIIDKLGYLKKTNYPRIGSKFLKKYNFLLN